jgi:hypothetical protein
MRKGYKERSVSYRKHNNIDEGGRKCTKCGIYKPWKEFRIAQKYAINGRDSHCKDCDKKSDKEYLTSKPDIRKNNDLKSKFGISLNEYTSILNSQNGACWICGSLPKTRRLAVDHRHTPGERKNKNYREIIRSNVRGLLCNWCNAGLQKFRDNPEFFRRAAEYIKTTPAQTILRSGEID